MVNVSPSPLRERGSTTVEFAIVSIVTLLLLFAIIDFGRALYAYHLVTNAARIATRYAIVRGSTCGVGCTVTSNDIQTYIRGMSPGIDPSAMNVSATWSADVPSGCSTAPFQGPGCIVSVNVAYTFAFITPLLPAIALPMSSTSKMSIAQ